MSRRPLQLDDVEWLRQKYIVECLYLREIAGIAGCSETAVFNAMHRCKIDMKHPDRARRSRYTELNDFEWLHQRYVSERLSSSQIAEIVGCTGVTVRNALHYKKISIRSDTDARWVNYHKYNCDGEYYPPLLNDVAWLQQKYVSERLPAYQIGVLVGCSGPIVTAALRGCGISIRTNAEAQMGRRFSEATKEKLRKARRLQRFPTHHTKPELMFETICTKNNLPFEFTGDGKVWIGKRGKQSINPDFICNADKKRFAVFVNGNYWHSQLLRPQLSETQRPEYQIKQSKKHRWVPIILWETDLKREDAEAFVLATLEKVGFSVPR